MMMPVGLENVWDFQSSQLYQAIFISFRSYSSII